MTMPLLNDERLEIRRLKVLADYLFGIGAGEALFSGEEVRIKYSKGTGRVRAIYVDGRRVFTFRPNDGMIALSLEGARRLLKVLPWPCLRVVISDDAAGYVARGRSVFAKHVIAVDKGIRPGMEVIIVDRRDNLIAIGRAMLSGEEMLTFNSGVAVRVRQGVADEKDEPSRATKAN